MATWRDLVRFEKGIRSPNVVEKWLEPVTITVDPIAGSDAPENDGRGATPLRTLLAALQRKPMAGDGAYQFASMGVNYIWRTPVTILLKAGDHGIPSDPAIMNWSTRADLRGVTIEGEYQEVATFRVDHRANDVHLWKALTDPAWTVDEHVGKLIKVPLDYGPPYGIYTLYYYIIANGTHDLTVGFNVPAGDAAPLDGSIVSIVEHATNFVGPAALNVWGDDWTWFQHLRFAPAAGSYGTCVGGVNGKVNFYSCAFEDPNATGVYLSEYGGGTILMGNIFARNCGSVVSCENSRLIVNSNIVTVNVGRMFDVRGSSLCLEFFTLHLRNSGDIFFLAYQNILRIRDWAIMCLSSARIFQMQNNSAGHLEIGPGGGVQILDNKPPSSYFFQMGADSTALLGYWASWTQEAVSVGETFMVGSTAFSAADLNGLYGKSYTDDDMHSWIKTP